MSLHPVQLSFNRAATSYDASARLQQQVADQLVRDACASLPPQFDGRILDAGCGTGYCLRQLHHHHPDAMLIGIDFAEAMLKQSAGSNPAWVINGDLQQLPLADQSVDLYVSSLAWQWCHTDQALREATRVLKPDASLWIATLVDGTFNELATAFKHTGLSPAAHMLPLPLAADIRDTFAQHGLNVHAAQTQAITTWHSDFSALRHSIRGVGANRRPSAHAERIDRAARQRLLAAYETHRSPHGLPLTYHVLTVHAQRI